MNQPNRLFLFTFILAIGFIFLSPHNVFASNTAPVLDASKTPNLSALIENAPAPSGAVGSLVSSLVDFATPTGQLDNVTDSDPGALLGVAVIGTDANVTCYYSLNGGTNWTLIGATSSASARLLAADSDNRIYCRPAPSFVATLTSAITFRAWDQTSGSDGGLADTTTNGGTTAFSVVTDGTRLFVAGIVSLFITTWRTTTPSESITIPTWSTGYNYNVDWGDSSTDTGDTGDASHSYASSGVHTVKISGTFPRIHFAFGGDFTKILSVEQWGTGAWDNMESAFAGCTNFVINATDAPDLSNVNDMIYMLRSTAVTNENLSSWNVSHVLLMTGLFQSTSFNGNISTWNPSSATDMSAMFIADPDFNGDISNWNVSSVTDMAAMFYGDAAFNQDISGWDVSNVTDMSSMFYGDTSFNQPIGVWGGETVNVATMADMFLGDTSFNQDISEWDVSDVINMEGMFDGATAFNQPLNNWGGSHMSQVQYLDHMFDGATIFNQPLNNWDVSGVLRTDLMFNDALAFNQDISSWNVSSVTNMQGMFYHALAFNNGGQPLSWGSHTHNVTTMSAMFYHDPVFNEPINDWDVSSVGDMAEMFQGATAFNQPLNNWDVSHVTNSMNGMFFLAVAFNQPLSHWDVSNVINMGQMFGGATNFNQDLSSWDVSNVTDLDEMFDQLTLSTANYDAILSAWSGLALQNGVPFGAGSSHYCNAEGARANLSSNFNWIISDGGKLCNSSGSSSHGGGSSTVQSRVNNLITMGNTKAADDLVKQYPAQFPSKTVSTLIPVPAKCSITSTLKYGMKNTAVNSEVKCLQTILNITPVSGYFGPLTKAAVIKFQKAHNLTTDGIVGPKTRALIVTTP